MTNVWSARAEAYRESDAHREGRDLELFAEWAEGSTALDVATGGGHVARVLREAGLEVRVGTTDLAQSSRGFTHGPGAEGLIKVVESDGILVGATVVGPAGGEILAMLTLAVHARIPVDTLTTMIYAYPTFHRAIESALDDLSH